MVSIAPPKAIEHPPAEAPANVSEANSAAEAAQRAKMQPDKVRVRLDEDAQRFVSILIDATTSETLRRYPSESQLAYSRAVMAYLRAQLAK